MIKAVTLDFWNTLFVDRRGHERERLRAQLLRHSLSAVGPAPRDEALFEALATGYDYFEHTWRDEQRTPSTREIVDTVLLSLKTRLPDDATDALAGQFADLLLQAPPDIIPDAPEAVSRLARECRLGIVSDTGYTPGSVLRQLLERHGILGHFDVCTFSNELGRAKPHPTAFLSTLEALGTRPTEAVHVGDMERTDIAGAHAVGMWSVLYVGVNDRDARRTTADAVVRRLTDVPRVVGDLTCPGCDLRQGSGDPT